MTECINLEPVTLRPSQIERLYNIKKGKLFYEFKRFEESGGREGLESIVIRGRGGRKGTRLVEVAVLKKWLARNRVKPGKQSQGGNESA